MGKKRNSDAKPAEKMLSLYTMLLFTGREATLSELSEELLCSKQTVIRLVEQFEGSRFGKLLSAKRGREVAYRLDRPKHMPKVSLNAEGLHQLALCRDFMLHLLPESMRKTVDTTLQQASAYLPDSGVPEDLLPVGQAFAKGRIDYSPFQESLRNIIRGIREQKVCMLRYKSSLQGEARKFDYAPKKLIAYRESIHIAGWIVTEKGSAAPIYENPANLALQRVLDVTVSRRSAAHIRDVPETNKGAFGLMQGEAFAMQVAFAPSAALYVAEREWSSDQKVLPLENGGITISMTARSPEEAVAWVLGFGDTAEVLSPQWLRDEVARQAAALVARYGTGRVE
jgi:predicted DNA-binding transcriptional regulator YafY